jgi:hypothetical protein
LNRTRRILWLVTGGEKAGTLLRLCAVDRSIPAGWAQRERALAFADQAAASQLGQNYARISIGGGCDIGANLDWRAFPAGWLLFRGLGLMQPAAPGAQAILERTRGGGTRFGGAIRSAT